jgi:hypothetical protein
MLPGLLRGTRCRRSGGLDTLLKAAILAFWPSAICPTFEVAVEAAVLRRRELVSPGPGLFLNFGIGRGRSNSVGRLGRLLPRGPAQVETRALVGGRIPFGELEYVAYSFHRRCPIQAAGLHIGSETQEMAHNRYPAERRTDASAHSRALAVDWSRPAYTRSSVGTPSCQSASASIG